MTLVVKSLPLALLATCCLIHHEAAPYLTHKLETLRNEPSHFIIDSTSLYSLVISYNSIGTMLEKHEYDNSTRKWYGAGAGKDPETWIPRWIDIRGRFSRRTHIFIRGSKKHAAIVAFYRKCLEIRRRRFTTKTVITVCCRLGSRANLLRDLNSNTWLSDRARWLGIATQWIRPQGCLDYNARFSDSNARSRYRSALAGQRDFGCGVEDSVGKGWHC